ELDCAETPRSCKAQGARAGAHTEHAAAKRWFDVAHHNTRAHTGILILASLSEHRVEVLADRGINEKVQPGTWDEIVRMLSAGLKSGEACAAFCAAIERCGEILAAHFPWPPDDCDELESKLVIEQ
ncbi:MAG: hypothetical protein L0Y78_08575, partial [candidate division NC10 bacterium]|nr:hypothetical protein [candidate division NC10 bacterium]